MRVELELHGDEFGRVGQQTSVVVSKHDDVGRCLVERQITVGREALSLISINSDIVALLQHLRYEVEVTFVGVLVGNNIVHTLLRRQEHILHTHDALVERTNQDVKCHTHYGFSDYRRFTLLSENRLQ